MAEFACTSRAGSASKDINPAACLPLSWMAAMSLHSVCGRIQKRNSREAASGVQPRLREA